MQFEPAEPMVTWLAPFPRPEPYYQDEWVTLYHGDCREGLKQLSIYDRVISAFGADLCIADPPYGDTSLDWDVDVDGWLDHLPVFNLWCFGSFRFFWEHGKDFEKWQLAQDLIWEKHNGSSFHADRFKRVHEHVVQFYKGSWDRLYKAPVTTPDATARAVRRKQRPPHTGHIEAGSYTSVDGGPRLMRSVIYVRSEHGRAVHPTQKPLGMIYPLIEYSTRPGAIILDPFSGSGSVLVAAKQLQRHAIGWEINERYCEAAAQRLSQEFLALEIAHKAGSNQ